MKDNYIVDVVKAMATEAIKKFGYEDLLLDNNIYYCNGNDGTDFDWECNDRTCEFFVYGKNEYGLLKAFLEKNGKVLAYVYDYKNPQKVVDRMTFETNLEEFDLEDIYYNLLNTRDNKGLYDKPIATIF